jgi:hypothetical protein
MSWFSELKSKVDESLAAQRAENDARLAKEYEAEQAKKAAELKTKTAESAKYLNTDVTPTSVGGNPSVNFYERTNYGNGNVISASLTGADNNPYFFVSRDYANKGFVDNGIQFYNSQFLSPGVFDSAAQYKLDDGTQGFVWKQEDAKKLGFLNPETSTIGSKRGYTIDGSNPAILGISYPVYTSDAFKQNLSYVSAPVKISDQLVGQQFITGDGTRYDGSFGYEYYLKGWAADRLRAGLPTVNALMPIVLEVLAPGTGAGSTYAAVSAATSATINALTTGNLEQGVVDLAKIYAASKVGDLVSKGINWSIPVDTNAVAKTILTGAGTNAVVQGLYGKDVSKAFIDGGIQAGIGAVAGSISGFGDLPKPVQKVFNAAVTTNLQGKSGKQIDAATLQAAISAGLGAVANGIDANARIQKEFGREATPEELNKFIWYTDRNAFNREFDTFAADTKSSQASAQQAAIDEQNRLDAEAAAQAQAQADAQAAIDAEVAAQAQAQADAQAAIDAQNKIDASEPPSTLPTEPILDDELEPPSTLPTEPILDDELEPPSTLPTEPTLDNELEPSCPDGYVFDRDSNSCVPINDSSLPPVKPTVKPPTKPPAKPPAKPTVTPPTKPPVTPPAEPDPLDAILGQQQTPVTYQTVTPELAKVFYGGQDFSSTPQKLNEQGQLAQQNPLLKEPNFVDPTKPLEKSFAGPQQTLNAQGQLAQKYSLLNEPNFLDPTKPLASSALAPQGNPKENDVAAMLTKIMGGRGNPTSQEELLKILGRA